MRVATGLTITAGAEGGPSAQPPIDCPNCPRLVDLRTKCRRDAPDWHNAPVPSFGPEDAPLLIVGLAPGLKGANRTGRPFTGDYAGIVLYPALLRHGFARGTFAERTDDGLELQRCRITNAVRCVPPQNKPNGLEISTCRIFLGGELRRETPPRMILALGRIAHESILRSLGYKSKEVPFRHGAEATLPNGQHLISSYHCSRYNMNTGRLTEAMFDAVMARIAAFLAASRRT